MIDYNVCKLIISYLFFLILLDETLPCIKPVNTTVMEGKKNFSKRLLKNIKKVKSKKDKQEVASPSQSPSNSSHSKGTLKKFMTLGHSSKKLLRPKSS